MHGGSDISAREIGAMLRARVDELGPMLVPGATRDGKFLTAGSIDGGPGQSFKLNLRGANRGMYTDFSADKGTPEYSGDVLTLIAVTMFGGRHKEGLAAAFAWGKSWLGLDDAPPERLRQIKREAKEHVKAADAEAEAEAKKQWGRAYNLWKGAIALPGTPGLSYLLTRLPGLEQLGKLPGALRYRPDVWCAVRRGKYPALIASIMGLDGKLLAVHRTYLDISRWDHATRTGPVGNVKVCVTADGATLWQPGMPFKAKSHKATLGRYVGGCIPLWKGDCSATLREIRAGKRVYVSEGIEDGLSVAIARPSERIVAGVALANMGGLILPEQAGPLVFIGQNDPADSKAARAFEGAVKRQQEARGADMVQHFNPPPEFKDCNDWLRGVAK